MLIHSTAQFTKQMTQNMEININAHSFAAIRNSFRVCFIVIVFFRRWYSIIQNLLVVFWPLFSASFFAMFVVVVLFLCFLFRILSSRLFNESDNVYDRLIIYNSGKRNEYWKWFWFQYQYQFRFHQMLKGDSPFMNGRVFKRHLYIRLIMQMSTQYLL